METKYELVIERVARREHYTGKPTGFCWRGILIQAEEVEGNEYWVKSVAGIFEYEDNEDAKIGRWMLPSVPFEISELHKEVDFGRARTPAGRIAKIIAHLRAQPLE